MSDKEQCCAGGCISQRMSALWRDIAATNITTEEWGRLSVEPYWPLGSRPMCLTCQEAKLRVKCWVRHGEPDYFFEQLEEKLCDVLIKHNARLIY